MTVRPAVPLRRLACYPRHRAYLTIRASAVEAQKPNGAPAPPTQLPKSNILPIPGLIEPDPPSWPSEAARRSLYQSSLVDRVDGLYAKVVGRMPDWIKGSFYRNGPGKFEGAHAVFDGCAMVVRFNISGAENQVVVSQRFLETTYYQHYKATGQISWRLAHDPGQCGSLHQLRYAGGLMKGALKHGVSMGDNALISIFAQGDKLVAHTETSAGTYLVDPDTLETLGRVQYKDKVHGMVKTAHPFFTRDGDIVNLAADFTPWWDGQYMRVPEITVCRQKPGSQDVREKIASVPYQRASRPTWVHQVPLSESWAVVIQNPAYYNVKAMVLGTPTKYMVFDWQPEDGTLIHAVRLDGSQVKSFRAPPFLATHYVNAFESEDGRFLHVDAAVTDDPSLMSHWTLANARAGPRLGKQIPNSVLRRITIDLEAPDGSYLGSPTLSLFQQLVPDELHGRSFELPSINPQYASRRHRFAYGTCAVRPTNAWNALCKLDTVTGDVKTWHEPGAVCWEPVFVPRPGAQAEDSGLALSTLMQADGRTALLMLDGSTFKEVARAVMPYGAPNGFHGCFVPAA